MTIPHPIASRCLNLTTAVALTVARAHAQRPDSELAKLRAEHEKTLASSSRLIDDIHRLTLRQLERERAEAGDYEMAGRVKARLEALERAPGTAAIVPPPVSHSLPAARALTRDGANTEGGREYVDFRKTGGKALWDVIGLEKGTYEVFLTYSVGLPRFDDSALGEGDNGPRDAPGGVIAFGEVTGLGGASPATLEKRVTTTGAWENYIRESIGRYEFRNVTATIKLEAASATDGGLLRLRTIELVKVVGGADDAGTRASSPEPARSLQELRARHRKSLREAADGLRPRFASDFLKLEQEFTAAGDAASAAAVATSRQRLFPAAPATGKSQDETSDPIPGLGEEPEAKQP